MSPLAHHLYTMACNNAWANHRLLKACAMLSQDDFIAPRSWEEVHVTCGLSEEAIWARS